MSSPGLSPADFPCTSPGRQLTFPLRHPLLQSPPPPFPVKQLFVLGPFRLGPKAPGSLPGPEMGLVFLDPDYGIQFPLPSDPGVQAPSPPPSDPGVQAPSPSSLRPRGPGPQPLLPETQGSRPPAPSSLRPRGPGPSPSSLRPRGPGPQPPPP
ncbi:Hypothetical predicted protein [Marmota monax]|uniref:Uncharacterized protein n=1 Tax=Marmota monax TaxID=9995 RepID=A0A5E4ADF8_MARMO|nr:hypothetical protein GHT09_004313 [Marmota monax]VTJ54876.1 Hypothetical predicted protein [Marmota monax]